MKKIRTHYDNLKVTRNAPIEVINAAYKSLSQKYHPDNYPNKQEALRITAIINDAYNILSDPIKRKEHDKWIQQKGKRFFFKKPKIFLKKRKINAHRKRSFSEKLINTLGSIILNVTEYFGLYFFGIIFLLLITTLTIDYFSNSKSYIKSPEEVVSSNKTYNLGPNNKPWPRKSGYIEGFKIKNNTGESSITIDNKQNDSNIHLKLVLHEETVSYPVRHVFIKAHDDLTMSYINSGKYDIRYRNLNTGKIEGSRIFNIKETEHITITLNKVIDGNLQINPLSEKNF